MYYLDASAIVKLIVIELGSEELRRYLAGSTALLTADIARVEVLRHARRRNGVTELQARTVLAEFTFISLSNRLLDRAARLEPATLRSLDAIHIASALLLREELEALVTYDHRMQQAAEALGLPVAAPV